MSSTLKNDRLIKALNKQKVDRTPLWIMRQAGRYLPEYRKTRAQAGSFLDLCKNPELAMEVTMQPIRRYGFDAAIIFSDILTIPDAMGLGLHFVENEGPKFSKPIRDVAAIDQLVVPEPNESLDYVMQAIKVTKQALNNEIPLIGFSGSPWTLACYMVEGGSSKNYGKIKSLMFSQPAACQQLLSKLAQSVSLYLQAQIQAGADVVMIFDTWGGVLRPQDYLNFSLNHMQAIVKDLKQKYPDTPIILFTKNGGLALEAMAETGCNALGVDWTISLQEAKNRVGDKVALQGNLDPCLLYAPKEILAKEIKDILAVYNGEPGHIFNLGHGIHPDIDPDKVGFLVDTVREFAG